MQGGRIGQHERQWSEHTSGFLRLPVFNLQLFESFLIAQEIKHYQAFSSSPLSGSDAWFMYLSCNRSFWILFVLQMIGCLFTNTIKYEEEGQ